MDEEKLGKVRMAAESDGTQLTVFDDGMIDETVMAVFDQEKNGTGDCALFPHSFILYDGFSVEAVRQFSQLMKRYGITFDGIRIRIGQENRSWTLRHLLSTAEAEYEAAVKLKVLQRLIQAGAAYLQAHAQEENTIRLRQILQDAYAYCTGKEFDAAETDRHCRVLSRELRQLERTVH